MNVLCGLKRPMLMNTDCVHTWWSAWVRVFLSDMLETHNPWKKNKLKNTFSALYDSIKDRTYRNIFYVQGGGGGGYNNFEIRNVETLLAEQC